PRSSGHARRFGRGPCGNGPAAVAGQPLRRSAREGAAPCVTAWSDVTITLPDLPDAPLSRARPAGAAHALTAMRPGQRSLATAPILRTFVPFYRQRRPTPT